jgi:hypothetical protein
MYVYTYIHMSLPSSSLLPPSLFLLNAIAVVICGVRFRRSVPACVLEVSFGEDSFSSHPILCQLFFILALVGDCASSWRSVQVRAANLV